MKEFSVYTNAINFEIVVKKIISRHYALKEVWDSTKDSYGYDLITSNNVPIEIKYLTHNDYNRFLSMARNALVHEENKRLIFVTNVLSRTSAEEKFKYEQYEEKCKIITLENLLYLCGDEEELKSQLLNCIEFSTENVVPEPLSNETKYWLKADQKYYATSTKSASTNYKNKLSKIPTGKKYFADFENFCADFVKNVFKDNIDVPTTQTRNNKEMFRFDIVAALKNNPENFWRFIYDKFNSCFILFECKNYSYKITQAEIYLTERYLYNNALRNVAIILTRKGADDNAIRATQDILKEHGKLILIFDDNDIKELCDIYADTLAKRNAISTSDYLMDKAKDFLINLDK